MSIIRIEDIAHVRFAAPDLKRMQAFLTDFGFACREVGGKLYAHGEDGRPFLHVTEPGRPKFLALGLRAANRADLETLAAAEGVTVEPSSEPGGGFIVRLVDPDGFHIEVVAEQAVSSPTPTFIETLRNRAAMAARRGRLVQLRRGPSHVFRIGHCVLNTSDFARSGEWYRHRFGLLRSDTIKAASDVEVGAFMRCDRGNRPSDHHTLFLAQLPQKVGFAHAAFEVSDFDDLMVGHNYLKAAGWKHAWGIGRHIMGSQIFDYWLDPWGHELEHWTDGDLLTADIPTNEMSVQDLLTVQWGEPFPLFKRRLAPSPNMIAWVAAMNVRIRRYLSRRTRKTALPD